METTYAAFYVPKKIKKKSITSWHSVSGIKNMLTNAANATGLSMKKSDFNLVAKYAIQRAVSPFVGKYAISGMVDILSGKNVVNKTKRDSFFDVFAPVLNNIAFVSGYSNLLDLSNSLKFSNNLNLSNFVEMLTEEINSKSNEGNLDYSGYGYEIPVDVVESCQYIYSEKVAEHSIQGVFDKNIWLSDLGLVKINFVGHMKNAAGELVVSNSYLQKLGECMQNKQPVVLRIGKDVYENCLIENMSPIITNIYEVKLVMSLKYSYSGDKLKNSRFGGKVLNPTTRNNVAYLLSKETFAGIFS